MNTHELLNPTNPLRNPGGHFLLTGILQGPASSPDSCWLRLEDYRGEVTVFDEWGVHRRLRGCTLPCPVWVDLQAWRHREGVPFSLIDIAPAAAHEIRVTSTLLPLSRTPTLAILARGALVRFHAGLRNQHLRRFLSELILDPQIFVPLLCVPASHKHHHAYPGGLLVHSTDMLDECASFMRSRMPDDPDAAEVTQMGYLLHDLGKVVTHRGGADAVTRARRHQDVTLELVAPYIEQLSWSDERSADRLNQILEHCAKPASQRSFDVFAGAHIVTTFDGMSVGFEREAAANDNVTAFSQREIVHG